MMEKLNPTAFDRDNRGQLLLLAAVAIVLLILAMVTLLNIAAFTDHERATGVSSDSSDTIKYMDDIEHDLETAIRHANHDPDQDRDDREDRLINDFDVVEDHYKSSIAGGGGTVSLDASDADVEEGVRIWQPRYHNMTVLQSEEGGPDLPGEAGEEAVENAENYGLVDGADEIRSFSLEITGENLVEEDDDPFTVETDSDVIEVFEDDIDNTRHAVVQMNGDEDLRCEVPLTDSSEDTMRISFTHGLIEKDTEEGIKSHCDALPGTNDISGITIENGDNIMAGLDMVVDGDEDNIELVDDEDEIEDSASHEDDIDRIEAHWATYSVTVDATIDTHKGKISTTLEVTPQRPGEIIAGGEE